MFHRRRWVMIGFIVLSVVSVWRLSFWMPQPIVNAQEAGRAKQRVESKPIDGQGEKSQVIAEQDAAMDRDAKQLATRVRTAKEPENATLRAELEELTERHFEQRQQRRETEIAELSDRVDKLRVAHHRRQENKPDIIHRRVTDLLDAEKELKWDDATRRSPIELNRTEIKSSNSGDSSKPVVTAALIRAAEARRTLAALEFKRATEANKQVPGAVTNLEIERFKANLKIAEAELDAAKVGVDLRQTPKQPANTTSTKAIPDSIPESK